MYMYVPSGHVATPQNMMIMSEHLLLHFTHEPAVCIEAVHGCNFGTPRSAMLNRGSYQGLTCARRSKMSRQIAIKVVAIDPPRGRPHMIQMFRVLLSSVCKHPMSECPLDGGWMDG